jgi:RNA polymerase sigma factor (sigma-70 family)
MRHLRRHLAEQAARALSDRELLLRFTRHQDQDAFAEVMRRHGPMVLHACRRLQPDEQDAEDVFQATFLVLARKAGALCWQESVANWLYTVAGNLARKARTAAARRRAHEACAGPRQGPGPALALVELRAVLDEELARLPERLRAPLVLCYLEGAPRDEAARQLGWSLATLKRRLDEGRHRLRDRLAARGLAPALLLTALLPAGAEAALPPALADATVRACGLFACKRELAGAVPPAVETMARGALRAMTWNRLRAVVVLLLLGGALAGGSAGMLPPGASVAPAPAPGAKAPAREVMLPVDQAVVHPVRAGWPAARALLLQPGGAAAIPCPPADAGELPALFLGARTRAKKGALEVRTGFAPTLLVAGLARDSGDRVNVVRLKRRGDRLELELTYTSLLAEGAEFWRNQRWVPLVQVPVELPPGAYQLRVTWSQVLSGKFPGAVPGPPRHDTVRFTVVAGRPNVSRVVSVKSADFRAAVQPKWRAPREGETTTVDLGLHVHNRSAEERKFSLFDTLSIKLETADGKACRLTGGRNGTKRLPPMVLPAGRAGFVSRQGRLEWADGKLRFTWRDGTGGSYSFNDLRPGRYAVRFTYEVRASGPAPGVASFWTGRTETDLVPFEIEPALER